MIYVDNRTGSKELLPLFPKGSAELTYLQYADFAFTGHHVDGDVLIGVERKRIGDFVNSMCSGRFSGKQLIGLVNSYHYVYLVIEGVFRANPKDGVLETHRYGQWQPYHAGNRTFMARDIWAFMTTVQMTCGLYCYHTNTESDTSYYIRALRHWWNKEYDEHKGHLQPHVGTAVELCRQTLLRRVAAQIDGVGWKKAKSIDQVYGSVAELVDAMPDELKTIEGVGDKLASSIHNQLYGGPAK